KNAEDTVCEMLGLNVSPPAEDIFRTWQVRARAIQGNIPRAFEPKPAGILALRWITNHLTTRGSQSSEAFAFKPIEDATRWVNASACLPEPMIDEGDMEELVDDK